MAILTLNELKAENAAAESASQDEPVDDIKESIKDEYVEDVKDVKADTEEISTEDDDEKKPELESWQLTDETESSEDDQKSGFVPNHEAAKRRKQAKALRGELKEKDSELEDLRKQVEALQVGKAPQAEVKQTISEPQLPEDMYDEDAMRKYHQDMINYTKNVGNQYKVDNEKSQKDAQQQALESAKQKSLDDHYERAAKLVSQGKVTEESFKGADKVVRMTLESMYPGQGDSSTDALISTLDNLGEGSEKVMYQLGVNPSKMQELQSKLTADPSGMLACAYLGKLQSQIQTPSKRRSQAPAPSSKADGDGGSAGKAGSLQKAYNKADGSQERITIKREAKLQGVDVSNW